MSITETADLPPIEAMTAPGWAEPRVRDIDLGQWLGLSRPRDIRKLAARHLEELAKLGPIMQIWGQGSHQPRHSGANTPHGGAVSGRRTGPATLEYWFNQAQALALSALSETELAAEIRAVLIRAFLQAGTGANNTAPGGGLLIETRPELEDPPYLNDAERRELNAARGKIAAQQLRIRDALRRADARHAAQRRYEQEWQERRTREIEEWRRSQGLIEE